MKNKVIIKRKGTNINNVQRIIERKLNFFGCFCKMTDDRLLKQIQREKCKRKKDTFTLYRLAANRTKWSQLVKYVMNTTEQ